MKEKNNSIFRKILIFPLVLYVTFLIALPILYIFIISFFKSDSYGGMLPTFTLVNYLELFKASYVKVFLKSGLIAVVSTFICILISYPFVLAISHKSKRTQTILTTMVMIPSLTNSLIRMYAWIILLRKSGVINCVLISFNIIDKPLSLMYNNLGIII